MTASSHVDLSQFIAEHPALSIDIPSSVPGPWGPIVLHALEQLDALAIELQPRGIEIEVGHVKEKFGDLRMYVYVRARASGPAPADGDGEAARKRAGVIVSAAQAAVRSVCEGCGAPADEIRSLGGWMSRRCDACAAVIRREVAAGLVERWMAAAKVRLSWHPLLARALAQIAEIQSQVEGEYIRLRLLGITEQEGRLSMSWGVRRLGVPEAESRDDPQLIAIRERVQRICADAESKADQLAQAKNDAS